MLLVLESLVIPCKWPINPLKFICYLLLVALIALYKKSLVTRCITHYSLFIGKLPFTAWKIYLLYLSKLLVTRCLLHKSDAFLKKLITNCKVLSLIVTEVSCCWEWIVCCFSDRTWLTRYLLLLPVSVTVRCYNVELITN